MTDQLSRARALGAVRECRHDSHCVSAPHSDCYHTEFDCPGPTIDIDRLLEIAEAAGKSCSDAFMIRVHAAAREGNYLANLAGDRERAKDRELVQVVEQVVAPLRAALPKEPNHD